MGLKFQKLRTICKLLVVLSLYICILMKANVLLLPHSFCFLHYLSSLRTLMVYAVFVGLLKENVLSSFSGWFC